MPADEAIDPCGICREELEGKEVVAACRRGSLASSHRFCKQCWDTWWPIGKRCPLCNSKTPFGEKGETMWDLLPIFLVAGTVAISLLFCALYVQPRPGNVFVYRGGVITGPLDLVGTGGPCWDVNGNGLCDPDERWRRPVCDWSACWIQGATS